ncbi:MAG TPA: hypothetical protein DCL16_09800 [Acidimicrobiaceae bacterium]|nr:hypothetical protein [Acidimicrobiaceae bacterium]
MNEQLRIIVNPVDSQPTSQVLAVAAVLALEWAAPYVHSVIGVDGQFVIRPEIDAAGGLLRLDAERSERLRLAGRDAVSEDESEIHIVEDDKGDWNIPTRLDSWWATGAALSATAFVGTTATGVAIAEILAISNRTEQRCIELLEKSQQWAMRQIDDLLRITADENPRLLADLMSSLSSQAEALAEAHALLRGRYQADIETISEHL